MKFADNAENRLQYFPNTSWALFPGIEQLGMRLAMREWKQSAYNSTSHSPFWFFSAWRLGLCGVTVQVHFTLILIT